VKKYRGRREARKLLPETKSDAHSTAMVIQYRQSNRAAPALRRDGQAAARSDANSFFRLIEMSLSFVREVVKGEVGQCLFIPLPLAHLVARRRLKIGVRVGACAGDSGSSLVKDLAHTSRILDIEGAKILLIELGVVKVRAIQNTHDNSASTMCALVLGQVITARKLLTAIGALEWLVVSVERAVMTLEVFLTTEAARAKSAYKRFGRILGQRLLAATAAGRRSRCSAVLIRARAGIVCMT
jgi:uncharacterized protein with PIN domain